MLFKIINKIRSILMSNENFARYQGVTIGKDCAIFIKDFGSESYLVTIGDHVQVTNDVKFFTHGGGWIFRNKYPKFDYFGKIKVGDNVYIGNRAMIMPGVTIGSNVIIGAGAIVTKSVEDGKIVAGNPAKVLGEVDDLEKRILKYNVNTKGLGRIEKKRFLSNLEEIKFLKK